MNRFLAGMGMAAVGIVSTAARADQAFFEALVGSRSASALFDVSGSTLTVTLTNTAPGDALVPVDVLTAVFFDLGIPVTLTRNSAVTMGSSTVFFGGSGPGGQVGGEWAYAGGLSGAPHNAAYGISSSGFGLFGEAHLFPGQNLQGPASPAGLQYGLTSAGDLPTTGNTPMTGTNALIHNSVVFSLSGLPAGYTADRIGNVSFQYGTSLGEPNIPAPGGALVLLGGGALLARRRR